MLSHINVGSGHDLTIAELAKIISKVIDYQGEIVFDPSKPDGAPRKFMDSSRLKTLGWEAPVDLEEGLKKAYADFLKNYSG
jgi:GDP-L-fucose synthase